MKRPDNGGASRSVPSGREPGDWIEKKCPVCKRKFRLERDKVHDRSRSYYPFCSSRCRMIDLGRWLNADYRFSSPADEEPADEEEAGPNE